MMAAVTLLSEAVHVFLEQVSGRWDDVVLAEMDVALQCTEFEAIFNQFPNPSEAEKLTKSQSDLDDVAVTVMQSLGDSMRGGESINASMDKSKDLSSAAREVRRMAEQNSCFQWCRRLSS